MAQNNQGRAANNLKKGAQVTVRAAKSAKNAAKAAAKAAGGNYVGAAVDLLKDENFRKLIAILLIINFFVIFCAIFLLPLALIEALVAAIEAIKEDWLAHYYDGESSIALFNAIEATLYTIGDGLAAVGDWISDKWNAFIGWFSSDEDEADDKEDEPGDEDAKIYSSPKDLGTVYTRKITTTQKKFYRRQDTIAEEIEDCDELTEYFEERAKKYLEENEIGVYEEDPNVPHTEYVAVEYHDPVFTVIREPLSREQIASLICLHTMQVQNEPSESQSKLSGYMKWLGYGKEPSSKKLKFTLKAGDEVIECSVRAQKGGFMPQYLIDERDARKNALDEDDEDGRDEIDEIYEDYSCSAIDFLTKITIPDLATLQPEIHQVTQDYYHHSIGPAPMSALQDSSIIVQMNNAPTDRQKKSGWTYYTGCVIHASEKDMSGENKKQYATSVNYAFVNMKYMGAIYEEKSNASTHTHNYYIKNNAWIVKNIDGVTHLYRRDDLGYQFDLSKPDVRVTRVKMLIYFKVPVTISCADVSTIVNLTGLYQGFLPGEVQEQANNG